MSQQQPFKDYYGVPLAQQLAERIQGVYPDFAAQLFVARVAAGIEPLELKGRVALIAEALREHLPPDYPRALEILCAILGPENPDEQGMFDFGYWLMPVGHFVERYGLEHFDQSLAAINAITRRFTGEFAIRPYLQHHQQRTLALLQQWASDENPHVRRLVSEGTRTRLPWATRLHAFISDPTPVLALLEQLKRDPSAYVRKSVANNLNDITRDHPDLVLQTLARWREDATPETQWIIRHALRSLVKRGDPHALRLLDFGPPQVALHDLALKPQRMRLGDTLTISFTLRSQASAPQKLVIDYLLHLVKANGSTQPRVFKLGTHTLPGGEAATFEKKHPLKPVTTRRYYSGQHRLEVQVNGQILGGAAFELEV
jgi:3-methyladenine DNA glycosylase AlkC